MTPVLASPRPEIEDSYIRLQLAAGIVCRAAEVLASESLSVRESGRYLLMADRVRSTFGSPCPDRPRFSSAPPAVIERSRRSRTLVEIIESYRGNDTARLRFAKILLRTLAWEPDRLPDTGE